MTVIEVISLLLLITNIIALVVEISNNKKR